MKKFYTSVTVEPAETGYTFHLDGRPVKTPAKNALCLPNRGLAEAVAHEWETDAEEIDPSNMQLTRLSNSAVDRVTVHRDAVIDEIAGFAATDLVCYRVNQPAELRQRQEASWAPLLDWLREQRGVELQVTEGVLPVKQSERDLAGLRAIVAGFDAFFLAGLHTVTTRCGSVVLGVAVAEGKIDGRQAWEYSLLEETFQIEEWGEDSEATERRRNLLVELEAAGDFLAYLRTE